MTHFPASSAVTTPETDPPALQVVRPENVRHAGASSGRSNQIVLVTEGTYPHAHGGVSVWCDQLVQGLSDQSFRVVALTAFSYQRPVWELPGHVTDLVTVGLWDHRRHRRRRSPRRGPEAETMTKVAPLAAALAALLTSPHDEVEWFGGFVDMVSRLDSADIERQLSFTELVNALDAEIGREGRWEAVATARGSDLVVVADMLDHLLRPLAIDPGPAAVYHASSNGLAALVCILAQRRHGSRFVLTEHGIYLRERYLELRRLPLARPARALLMRFHRLVSGAAYARASVVTPGSRWNLRWEARHGAPVELVRTIYNGIEPDEFPERDEEPAEPVVSWLGRIDPIKDLETLVAAFAVVHERCPAATLRIYGRCPASAEAYKAKLEAQITELGLESTVIFAGGVAVSADAYRDAQIGVLSSISEGFPYSLIEAMVSGLPTVATGVGGVDEAVADAGLVVPPRAPELLGEAIVELLEDGPRRRHLGELARKRVLELFTVQQCIDDYRRTYAEVRATFRVPRLRLVAGPGGDAEADADAAADGGSGTPAPGERLRAPLGGDEREELVAALGGTGALAQTLDADEVAATLESVGVTDQVATSRFGARDVFELAERVWRAGGGSSDPPRPEVQRTPRPDGAFSRGLAYVLPAVVVAAAVIGGADQAALVMASIVAWGLGQAGGVLAYTLLHRSPRGTTDLGPLRQGVAASIGIATAVGLAVATLRSSGPGAGLAGALPLLHLVGATGLIVTGRTRHLLFALAPVSLLSLAVVLLSQPSLAPLVGPASLATVAANLGVVCWLAWGGSATPAGSGRVLELADWVGAVPLAVCGWCTAGFALLSVTTLGHLAGLAQVDSRLWLVLGLPLWTMVGGCEWFFLAVRRSLAAQLEASGSIRAFRLAATRTVAWSTAGGALVLGPGAVGLAAVICVALSELSVASAITAASVFGVVAMALYGATVLTAAAHSGRVLVVTAVAVVALLWVLVTARNPLGLGDPQAALVVGGSVAAVLCSGAGRVLIDPASHR